MVKAWTKNNLRESTHTLGRYLAIVGIVALGVGFFAGVKTAKPAMLQTGAHYVEQTRMFDYRLISTLGMTPADAEYFAALPEVECFLSPVLSSVWRQWASQRAKKPCPMGCLTCSSTFSFSSLSVISSS